jgi:hypothetical protein
MIGKLLAAPLNEGPPRRLKGRRARATFVALRPQSGSCESVWAAGTGSLAEAPIEWRLDGSHGRLD